MLTTIPIGIVRPALWSAVAGLSIEIPLFFFLGFYACQRFAFYLSGSEPVANLTAYMWESIGWYASPCII